MIAVILNHIYGIVYSNQAVVFYTLFSVSLLVLCGGINSVISIKRKKILKVYNRELFKSLVKFWIAYMSSTALFCIYHFGQFNFIEFRQYLINFNTPGSYYVCFYIQLMFVAPALSLIFIAFNNSKWIQGILLIVSAVVSFILNKYTIVGNLLLGANYVLGGSYFFIFTFGMFFILNLKWFNKLIIKICILICSSLYLGMFVKFHLYEKAWSNPPNVLAIAYTIVIFLFLYYLLQTTYSVLINQNFVNRIIKPITILGEYSLWIFLFHFLVIDFLKEKTNIIFSENNFLKFGVFFIGSLYIPVIVKKVYDFFKIKLYFIVNKRLNNQAYYKKIERDGRKHDK